jgi:site-specific recombinase XerD
MQGRGRWRAQKSRFAKLATCHPFWHSFARELLERADEIRTIQGLSDHNGLKTKMIYAYVMNRKGQGVP